MGLPSGHSRVPEALEGDGHLCDPPILNQASPGVEQRIPREILLDRPDSGTGGTAATATSAATTTGATTSADVRPAQTGVPHRVRLHALPVDSEHECSLLIEEGVQIHRDAIVAVDPVAVAAVGANRARIRIVCVEREVQTTTVVGNPDFRPLGRRRAINRLHLRKAGDAGRLEPDAIIELAVDHRRAREAGNVESWTARRRLPLGNGRRGDQRKGRHNDESPCGLLSTSAIFWRSCQPDAAAAIVDRLLCHGELHLDAETPWCQIS